MDKLELKIPPPLVMLAIAAAMWLASRAGPAFEFELPWRVGAAAALAICAVAVALAGIVAFARAGTTIDPHKPDASSAIVTRGIYRFTRNPMYLGLLLLLAAWAVWLANALAFVLLPVFVLYIDRLQIGPEERVLEAKFGEAYAAYKRAVRRWI